MGIKIVTMNKKTTSAVHWTLHWSTDCPTTSKEIFIVFFVILVISTIYSIQDVSLSLQNSWRIRMTPITSDPDKMPSFLELLKNFSKT